MTVLAMFPLGSTVFPHQVVPLHVFEPRYRAMFEQLTEDAESPEFGIVLINRGHEVGGGDQRSAVGTRVQVLQSERSEDGRWAVIAVGLERLDIIEWLPDDPYPRAVVASRRVVDNGGTNLGDLESELMKTLRLTAQTAGVEAPERFEFSDDVLTRLDQLSALAPLTDFDRQEVLVAESTSEQMSTLSLALQTKQMLIRAQLGHGDELG